MPGVKFVLKFGVNGMLSFVGNIISIYGINCQ